MKRSSSTRRTGALLGAVMAGSFAAVLATIFPINSYYGNAGIVDSVTVVSSSTSYALNNFPTRGGVTVRVYDAASTPAAGAAPGLQVQLGIGPVGTDPSGWSNWAWATYSSENAQGELWSAKGPELAVGTYSFTFRSRLNGGAWTYGDRNGSQNGVDSAQFGTLTVNTCSGIGAVPVTPASGVSVYGNRVQLFATAFNDYQVQSVLFEYRQPTGSGPWTAVVAQGSTVNPAVDAPFGVLWDTTGLASGDVEVRATATDLCSQQVIGATSVLTIDSVSPTILGNAGTGGDVQLTQQLSQAGTAEVRVTDPAGGFTAAIQIPGSNLPNPTSSASVTTEAGTAGATFMVASNSLEAVGSNITVTVTSGGSPITTFATPLTFNFTWPDLNSDGLVDGTTIAETTLNAYFYNTGTSAWESAGTVITRDNVNNRLEVSVDHLTEFGLFGAPNSKVSDWSVY